MASYEASGPRSGLAGMDQLGAALGRRISMIFSWGCARTPAGVQFYWIGHLLILLADPVPCYCSLTLLDDVLIKHFFYILHLLAL